MCLADKLVSHEGHSVLMVIFVFRWVIITINDELRPNLDIIFLEVLFRITCVIDSDQAFNPLIDLYTTIQDDGRLCFEPELGIFSWLCISQITLRENDFIFVLFIGFRLFCHLYEPVFYVILNVLQIVVFALVQKHNRDYECEQ
mgnify:CR=1 FL=1